MSIKIHETAFVTATYRASNEELSKDKYSDFWRNPGTDRWIDNYVNKVSLMEPFTHCLRNRYFYETIRRFVEEQQIEVVVNFGCGFSMYPFLFQETLVHVEIDQQDIINYKKNEIQELVNLGQLPKREIHYIAKDFNLQKDELESELKSIIKGRRSFVLLEGVIFFLSKTSTEELINLFSRIQAQGSYFGSVSFVDGVENTACFKRLVNFFEKEVRLNSKFEYLTLPTSFYETLPNYELVEHEDYVSLSEKYSPEQRIENGDSILNEHLYLMRRNERD